MPGTARAADFEPRVAGAVAFGTANTQGRRGGEETGRFGAEEAVSDGDLIRVEGEPGGVSQDGGRSGIVPDSGQSE